MDKKYQKRLERNFLKYAWLRVVTMRVYYPIVGIYLVTVGALSMSEVAAIAVISAVASFIFQLPAGYFSDKFGNARAMKLSSIIMLTSPLWYLVLPNFWGGLIAAVLFHIGLVFVGDGVGESMIHDTLVKLKREREYTKIMGRAVSYGLIGNMIAVSVVPLTYPIHHSLPFLIGFATQIAVFILVRSFEYPDLPRLHAPKSPLIALKNIVNWRNVALFVFFGFVTGLSKLSGVGEYSQIRLTELGVAVGLLGLVQAFGSLIGAILGRVIHLFDKVKPQLFYLIDLSLATGCLAAIGLTSSWVVGVVAMALFTGWFRVRKIMYESKLLLELGHVYKATLLSALNFFSNLWQMIAPAMLAWSVVTRGNSLAGGYVLFAAAAFMIGLLLLGWIGLTLQRKKQSS
ncbi:MFS transporter [Candidatus Saccharibacteria bacterium]|nr:MFS transporter [Candidatus Saccharibacteria bacterium]